VRAAIHKASPKLISGRIVRWFGVNQRDLPWRRTHDPYAIWISEIMLQQTQVKTVIPYYERWMRELPTIASFAAAKSQRVLKLWEGLGYYRRVRNAQEAAELVVRDFGGHFPTKFDDVLALPGIGRYTAGAICSLAYNAATPILDGNVIRVLCRVYAIGGNPRDKKVNARLWELAGELVASAKDRSALNQGLMELGALICAPREPKCKACPLAATCAAREQGRVEAFPMLNSPPPPTSRKFAAYIVRRDDHYLVRQRPAHQVNGGLWEFPNAEGGHPSEFHILDAEPVWRIRHSITRYRILLEAFSARLANGEAPAGARWRTLAQLDKLPLASAHRKILELVKSREAGDTAPCPRRLKAT